MAQSDPGRRASSRRAVAWPIAAAAIAYVGALWLTDPVFLADSEDYAQSIAGHLAGVDCVFWEFGHLAWYPLGYWLYATVALPIEGPAQTVVLDILSMLAVVSAVAGLVVLATGGIWLARRNAHGGAVLFALALLLSSKAFLNFAQVGSPYIPGLALLLAGLVVLRPRATGSTSSARSIVAGILFAGSALLWFPFILAIPAALLSPVALEPNGRRSWPAPLTTAVAGAIVGLLALAAGGRQLGLESVSDYQTWMSASTHGIEGVGGIPRAVIGFARSLVDTGDYGQLVKRYLVGDPANPVALKQLFAVPLAQILLVYLGAAWMLWLAAHTATGRRALAFLVLNALPVLAFAIAWQGGDLERYLPLTPGIILVAAEAYRAAASVAARTILVLLLGAMALSNVPTMTLWTMQRAERLPATRLSGLPDDASPRLLVITHWQDEVMQFRRNRPWSELHRRAGVIYPLMTPGTPSVLDWRVQFQRRVDLAWRTGSDVWVSERLLSPTPRAEFDWVEGDAGLRWRQLPEYFGRLEYDDRVGPPSDGFLHLAPSPRNRTTFAELAGPLAEPSQPLRCQLPERLTLR